MELKLYDMNGYAHNKAYLPDDSARGTMTVVNATLSLPRGEIHLSDIPIFTLDSITHLSFVMSNKTWIVEITQKSVMGKNLYILSYEVDYLKTFFKNADGGLNLILERTTNPDYQNKRLFDSRIKLADYYTYDDIIAHDYAFDSDIIVVMSNSYIAFDNKAGVTVFLLGDNEHTATSSLNALMSALMTSDVISTAIGKSKGDTILSQIMGVYIVPRIPDALRNSGESGLLTYITNNSLGTHTTAIIDGCYGKYLVVNHDESLTMQILDTGITYDVSDWRNLKPVCNLLMYIPLIGTLNIPTEHLKNNTDTIKFKYIIDYVTGTMTVYTIDMHTCIANIKLPNIPLSTIEKSDITQVLNNPVRSAVELVTGSTMSDTPVTLAEGSGYNALLYKKIYTQKVYQKALNYDLTARIGALSYQNIMVSLIKSAKNTYRYYVNADCLSFLKGQTWYVEGVVNALVNGFEY